MEPTKRIMLSSKFNDEISLNVSSCTTNVLVMNFNLLSKSFKYAKDNYGFVIYECFEKDGDIQFSSGNSQYYDINSFHGFEKEYGTLTLPGFTKDLKSRKLYAIGLTIKGTKNQDTAQGKSDLASIAYFMPDSNNDDEIPDREKTHVEIDKDFAKLESLIKINYSIPTHTQAGTPDMCKHFVRIYETKKENLFLGGAEIKGEQAINLDSYDGSVIFKNLAYGNLKDDKIYTLAYCHSTTTHTEKIDTFNFVATYEFKSSIVNG